MAAAGKKAVFIIAPDRFRDEEYFVPVKILEEAGINIITASLKLDVAAGMLGAKVKPDMLLKEVRAENFDAVIFVGGQGAAIYWEDKTARGLITDAVKKNKIVAAICIAPVTLAKAGVLRDRKAAVFPSEKNTIEKLGAKYSGSNVTVEGNIVTADGPASAPQFGTAILELLNKT